MSSTSADSFSPYGRQNSVPELRVLKTTVFKTT